jgi:hypothetical protein
MGFFCGRDLKMIRREGYERRDGEKVSDSDLLHVFAIEQPLFNVFRLVTAHIIVESEIDHD